MKKIILVGESAGGKDFLLAGLVKMGVKPCVKTTTRPIRNKEIDGITYHYTTNEAFNNIISDMVVYQRFDLNIDNVDKVWYYGIAYSEFQLGQVCIMTPSEIDSLPDSIRGNSHIVYVSISEDIRRERLQNREDNNDSIERRIKSDIIDFKDFSNFDTIITDSMFSVDEIFKALCTEHHPS